MVIRLEAGKDYEQSIGNGLTFKIAAMKDEAWGWILSLEDNAGRVYIYPWDGGSISMLAVRVG
jgi:hypothetical protein